MLPCVLKVNNVVDIRHAAASLLSLSAEGEAIFSIVENNKNV